MNKKLFTTLGISIVLAIASYFIYGVFATSNPFSWNNGLVGYWSFDGQYTTSTNGTRDTSGQNNWGSFNGGVKPTAGISGQALSFDGTDDYVTVSTSPNLSSLTISLWAKIKSTADNNSFISFIGTGGGQPIFENIALGGYGLRIGHFGSGADLNANQSMSAGVWHHVVFIKVVGGTNAIYLDGVLITSAADTSTGTVGGGFYIGKRQNTTYFFNGLIDEVRIYNRALSADEVKQHYDQTRRNLVINNPSGTPPVGWWKMDEASGATVRDYSVNANNGTKYWMVTSTDYGLADGKIGKALSFDGVDDYVDAGDINALDSASAFTITGWARQNALDVKAGIFAKRSGTYTRVEFTAYNDGNMYALIGTGAATANGNFDYSTAVSANTWFYWTVVFDGSGSGNSDRLKIYINGINQTLSFTGTIPSVTQNMGTASFIIGNYVSENTFWNGLLDEVRIYNYARTADQIAADYRAGAYRTIIGTSVPSTWWTSGLVGYWNFDGPNTTSTNGTRDTSGQNNWGTFSGGVKPIGGISGQALSFDGVDDYVSFTSQVIPLGAKTVECWFKTTDSNSALIDNSATAGVNHGSSLFLGSNLKIGFVSSKGTAGIYRFLVWSASVVNDNKWYHAVGTWDGTTNTNAVNLYINGVLEGQTTALTTETTNASNNLLFGNLGQPYQTGYFYAGLIDEVRIYNRALSADEVKQHYEQTRRNLGM